MSFDFAILDTATLSNEGVAMSVLNPRTKQPALDSEGKRVTITLRGRNSTAARMAQRQSDIRRLELIREEKKITPEIIEQEDVDLLTACTVTWSFDTLDGKEFSCTPENARKFWSDPRFVVTREQAIVFLTEDANFMKG